MMEKAFGTADDALAELQLEYSHSNKQRKPKKTAAEAWQSLEEDFVSKKPRKPREVHCTDGERKTYPLQKSRKTKPSNYKAANTSQYPECSSDPIIECSNADIELDDLCMEQTCNQRETSYDHSDKLWTNIREEIFIIFKHVYYHVEEKHLKVAETYTQDDGCDCDAVSSINNVKIYTDSGVIISRYAFKSSCKCPSRYNNMVREGLWPLSLGGQPSFVTFGLIDMCSQLLSACPSLSYAALSQALSNICMRKTLNSDNKVRAELISCSMREFRNMEFRAEGEVFDPFSCPSCLNNPHAIHLDGNMKLYRYKSAGQRSSIEARSKGLFDPDDAVNKLVETVRSDKNNKTAKTCGASQWKAAKANAPAPSALIDETGIELATCRHVFIQKAINMTRGEIYAYPYYMQLQFPGAEYICLDTACRYWPWLRRLDPELAVKQKPLLSVMHSKAHQFKCQVTWNGRWTDGAGLSTGETTEQANSYVSRLGITTKHMLKAVREERLTEGAAYWNRQKLLNLPRELLKCSKRTLQRRATSQLQLAELENNHQLGQSQIVDFITYLQTGYQDTQNTELEAKISAESCLRQTTIARMTSCKSTKQRYRLQKKLVKCNNSLERLVEEYVEEHGDITTDELLNMAKRNEQASLPWITASQFGGQFDILLKAAELYQYIRRCTEELNILQSEIKNIYSTVERHIESAAPDSRKMTVFRVLRSQLSEAFIGSGFEPNLNTPSDDDSDSETEDDWLSDDE